MAISYDTGPESPLDPTHSADPHADIGGAFFQAVYLDSPSFQIIGGAECSLDIEIEEIHVTRPLHVRKKYPVARRRLSILSVPRSPRSPASPRTRDSRSFSHSQRAHPLPSFTVHQPPPITMLPLPPAPSGLTGVPFKLSAPPRPQRTRRRSPSELHLGLGQFDEYEVAIKPRPSPPISPAESPIKQHFAEEFYKKPLPLPPSPLTPSRAPRKAAALLGSGYTTPSAKLKPTTKPSSSSSNISPARLHSSHSSTKREHFRPLPASKLYEIEQFFGSRPKCRPCNSSTSNASAQNLHRSRPALFEQVQGTGERHIGKGNTVRHMGQDGSMWMDVEEEQEFAWLMSEVFANLPAPVNASSQVIYEGEADEEEWGMTTFTSVLKMKKSMKVEETDFEVMPLPSRSTTTSDRPSRPRSPSPQQKSKHRPPPLTLSEGRPTNLPAILTGPSPPLPNLPPDTLFSHPRHAPAVPRQTEPVVAMPEKALEVSFFEPATPLPVQKGGAGKWLKRVKELKI